MYLPANLVTIAPCFDSSLDPRASVVVTTISIAIGIEATINTTVKLIDSLTSVPEVNKYINTIPDNKKDIATNTIIIRSNIFCKDPSSSGPWSNDAVLPKNVLEPVNSTVPSTSPLTTLEPILQILPMLLI